MSDMSIFVSEMREFGLLHETDPSLPIPTLESSLYDDYESFLPLESNVVDDGKDDKKRGKREREASRGRPVGQHDRVSVCCRSSAPSSC